MDFLIGILRLLVLILIRVYTHTCVYKGIEEEV